MNNSLLNSYLNESKTKHSSIIITKILISLIILFSSLIFVSLNDKNKALFNKYIMEDNFNFMNFKKVYYKLFGKPKTKEEISVMGSNLEYSGVSNYYNGEAFDIEKDSIIEAIGGGIVVFIGDKDEFKNTVIIQGSDGYDIWYGNLENINVKMYDYVNAGQILANASDKLYLLITKDSNYYKYEEYQNKI